MQANDIVQTNVLEAFSICSLPVYLILLYPSILQITPKDSFSNGISMYSRCSGFHLRNSREDSKPWEAWIIQVQVRCSRIEVEKSEFSFFQWRVKFLRNRRKKERMIEIKGEEGKKICFPWVSFLSRYTYFVVIKPVKFYFIASSGCMNLD